MARKAKKEVVLANLVNTSREITNLLAVGKSDAQGVFPNSESNFIVRRLQMLENRKSNWRGATLHEMTIPRSAAELLADKIKQQIDQPKHELQATDFGEASQPASPRKKQTA